MIMLLIKDIVLWSFFDFSANKKYNFIRNNALFKAAL